MIHLFKYLCPILVFTLLGCSDKDAPTLSADKKPTVYTVNYPLAYFAERIAGEAVNVVFPEMEGDPAFWEPAPEELAGFQTADWILLNGAGYAKWLGYASLPQSRMVNTSSGFADRYIEIANAATHSHVDGEAHAHGATAFTTWLDLRLAVEQAAAINETLSLDASGFEALKSDLLSLDKALELAFAPLSGQPLIGSHPVYQYLRERYGLNLKSLHWEPDVMPDANMWRELEALRVDHPSTILLWEGEPLPEIKNRLSALGIRSVVFDPSGNRPDSGDFLSVMQQNLLNIQSIEVK